jgi:hypothetical protein
MKKDVIPNRADGEGPHNNAKAPTAPMRASKDGEDPHGSYSLPNSRKVYVAGKIRPSHAFSKHGFLA